MGSMRDYLTVFFKRKISILSIFFTIVVATTLLVIFLPPVYEAKTTLLVRYGREYLNQPEMGPVQPGMSMYLNQEEIINSEVEILTSPGLAKKVIETLKIGNIYPDLLKDPPRRMKPIDAAVIMFGKKLKVAAVKKSNVIQVSFRHEDPRIAANALNLLVELFKAKHLEVYSTPQSSFLEGQAAAYQQKLGETEKSLEAFKQKNEVYSLDEQRSLLLKQRTDLDTELINTRNTVAELQKKLASLQASTGSLKKNKNLYTATERDKIIVDAQSKLLALELSEQELLRKYKESNRLVVDVRKQIQLVKGFLKANEQDITEKVTTGNVVFQEAQKELVGAEADLHGQRAKMATMSRQLKQLDRDIQVLDLQENKIKDLKRQLAMNEKNFQIYGDKMEEARIMDDMNRLKLANISVIQSAVPPVKPVWPRKRLSVAVSIIFGVLFGIGFALFSELNSQGLVSPEIAERRLNLVVLAAIPYKE